MATEAIDFGYCRDLIERAEEIFSERAALLDGYEKYFSYRQVTPHARRE